MISWPISVIVDAGSQLEHATREKLEGGNHSVFRCKGSNFLTYELFDSTILRFMQCSTDRRDCCISNLGAITFKFWVQSKF